MKKNFFLLFAVTLVSLATSFSSVSFADTPTTIKQAVETQQRSQQLLENADTLKQQMRPGSTPLSTILAINELVKKRNYKKAAKYVDMRYLPAKVVKIGAPELLRELTIVWNQQKLLDLTQISNLPEGASNDGLPEYRDLLGYLESSQGKIPVYLQKIYVKNGHIWKISNRTMVQVPALWKEFGYPPWADNLSQWLPNFTLFHMENWQLVALIFIFLVSWYASRLFTAIVAFVWIKLFPSKTAIEHFILHGARYAIAIIGVESGVEQLGLSVQAKVVFASGILDYLALMFIVLGLIELFAQRMTNKLDEKAFSRSIIRPLSTTVKVLTVIVLILAWLSDAGYSLTTVLTGLGIGSLAIALAAQKTLENVFGAFTLYIARPISPGDFCKFGEITGTVEEIGLRSTRIRKIDRTIVHVPNSVFSSKELENYAEIDRRHYKKELRIRLDTTPEQIRQLLIALRQVIIGHPQVLDIAARVRFADIERDAFRIVINCYINTKLLPKFKAIEEDLNFHLLDTLKKLDIRLASPEIRVVTSRSEPASEAAQQAAEAEIRELIEQEKLPFPNFSADEKSEIQNTLPYPPAGSPKKTSTSEEKAKE